MEIKLGFTKLDEGILQSSIMAEDGDTFKVWVALLATCKQDGIAHCSSVFIASICRLPQKKADEILKKFENPDPRSRSKEQEGRRIKRVDGGYELINYFDYRDSSLKDAEAERKRIYRQKIKGKGEDGPDNSGQCPDNLGHVPNSPDSSASASASASSLKEGGKGGERERAKFMGGADDEAITSEFKDLWDGWPIKKDKDQAFINYRRERKTHTVEELEKAVDGYEAFLKNQRLKKGFDQTPLYLSTFLNKNRWKEYLDEKYTPAL